MEPFAAQAHGGTALSARSWAAQQLHGGRYADYTDGRRTSPPRQRLVGNKSVLHEQLHAQLAALPQSAGHLAMDPRDLRPQQQRQERGQLPALPRALPAPGHPRSQGTPRGAGPGPAGAADGAADDQHPPPEGAPYQQPPARVMTVGSVLGPLTADVFAGAPPAAPLASFERMGPARSSPGVELRRSTRVSRPPAHLSAQATAPVGASTGAAHHRKGAHAAAPYLAPMVASRVVPEPRIRRFKR